MRQGQFFPLTCGSCQDVMRSGIDLELVKSGVNPLITTLNQFPLFLLVLFISSVMSIIPLSTFSFMQTEMPLSGPLFRLLMKRSREKEKD